MKKITIYHTNDIHSRFEKLAGISTYLKNNQTENDFYFDAGDLLDYSSPMVYGDNGESGLKLMKYLGCDALSLGNNESFIGDERISRLLENSDVSLLSANLKLLNKEEIPNLTKSIRIERAGYSFLVIGINPHFSKEMTDSYNIFYNLYGLASTNPLNEIRKVISESEKSDFIILLSHSALQIDKYIAENIADIDIIVGGHSHSIIEENLSVNNTIIVQSGSYAELLGKLDIYVDNGIIKKFENYNLNNIFEADKDYLKLFEERKRIVEAKLNKTIGILNNLEFEFDQINCSQMRYLCDLVKEEYTADLCIINNGIFNHLLEGEISKKKLLEASPSPLNPTRIQILGKVIKEGYLLSLDKELSNSEIKGAGFRGKILGTLSYSSNVEIIDNELYIDKERLKNDNVYDVLTSDFLQRGDGYPMFLKENKDCQYYPLFFYELIEKDLINNK